MASLGFRCCFDTAVKTLSISSYIIFYASSTFFDDIKSMNLFFNSVSPLAISLSRLLSSYVFEKSRTNVPIYANSRCRFVAIPPRSRSIPSSCIVVGNRGCTWFVRCTQSNLYDSTADSRGLPRACVATSYGIVV